MFMGYEWDPAKNRANIAKRGIDFADAVRIFDGPTLEKADDRYDYGEARTSAVGVMDGREVADFERPRHMRAREAEGFRGLPRARRRIS